MFDGLKRRLLAEDLAVDDNKRVNTAVCALLIEMANFDDDFCEEEKNVILNLIKDKFDMSSKEAEELIKIAHEESQKSIDLWHFTKLINQNYSKDEKIQLLEMLWKVIYADGVLQGSEDCLVHKLAKLLKLEHRDLINSKIIAKEDV